MKVTFLGQGYEPLSDKSVGNHLLNFLSQTTFHTFIGISAFASEAGVFGLSGYIQNAKQNFKNLALIVGIDQNGTSKEALEEILALNINSYIFYQAESPIFHPKIYLFEGDDDVKLIVGSSNLTGRGLFTNVESSLLIEFNEVDKEGMVLLSELKSYYKSLFDFTDSNLFKISKAVIDDFFAKGIVPDEIIRRRIYSSKNATDILPSILATLITIPKRAVAKISSAFPLKQRATNKPITPTQSFAQTTPSQQIENVTALITQNAGKVLVWESGPLTQRDLTIPKGKNTNQTGSMLFKKGKTLGIDQRNYFRNEVFSGLAWVSDIDIKTAHLERATAFFRIIIMGVDHGVFPLSISHNTKTNTKTYLQKNSMTSLSWGKAKSLIANSNLIGKSASLYKENINPNHYILEIQ